MSDELKDAAVEPVKDAFEAFSADPNQAPEDRKRIEDESLVGLEQRVNDQETRLSLIEAKFGITQG